MPNLKLQYRYKDLYEDLLGLDTNKKYNYFCDQPLSDGETYAFPIGTYGYITDYHRPLTDDDFIWFKFKKNETTSTLFLGDQGTLKTCLAKRFIFYHHKAGYKCVSLESKSTDMLTASLRASDWVKTFLHPDEIPEGMPVYSVLPSFVLEKTPSHIKGLYHHHTEDIRKYDKMRLWITLNIGGTGAIWLQQNHKKFKKLIDVYKKLSEDSRKTAGGMRKLNYHAVQSLFTKLGMIFEDKYFDDILEPVAIKKILDKNKVLNYSFLSDNSSYLSGTITTLLNSLWGIQENEPRGLGEMPTPLLIHCDDVRPYASPDLDENMNACVNTLKDCLILWRSLGFNMIFSIQNIREINRTIAEQCKNIFISSITNVNAMRDFVKDTNILTEIENLEYEPNEHRIQYLWLKPDKKQCVKFYPLLPQVKHFA